MSRGAVQLEDLLRHGNKSNLQASGKKATCKLHEAALARHRKREQIVVEKADASDVLVPRPDVPQLSQYRLAYQIARRFGTGEDYAQQSHESQVQGRCNPCIAFQLASGL